MHTRRYNAPMRTLFLTAAQRERLELLFADFRSLPRGLHAIEKQIEAIGEQAKTAEEGRKCKRETPPRLHAELQLPETVQDYYRTTQHAEPGKRRREWAALGISALTLVAVIGYAIITYRQWHTMDATFREVKKQTDSAQAQVITMQKQLVASERPWISARIFLTQPLIFTGKGIATIGVGAIMKNVGHSPAINVRFDSKVIMVLGAEDLHKRQVDYGKIWERRSATGGLPGNTIFPGDEHPDHGITDMSADEIKAGLAKSPIPGKVTPMLIVCIDYMFYSGPEHHQTWYAYPLGRPDPKHPGMWMGFFVPSGTPEGVVLIGSMMGEWAN